MHSGRRETWRGRILDPTIFVDVHEGMKIMKEEIFDPVVCITKFKTLEEVVKATNKTDYGLAGAVFTKDISRAIRVSNELCAGTVWVVS